MVQQKLENETSAVSGDGNAGSSAQKSGNNPPSPKSRLAMLKRGKKSTANASDPFRFQNNGVNYKGKLIGEQNVDAARGDTMCAEAMKAAKAAVKAANAHKTRINLQINIEGLKILDEKSGAVLHNFPVSRISFIARDTQDARAFGLVYGDGHGKYKFYGIKTAQSADHAVLAIRDMFQVVFEMKKKQIEQAKQPESKDGNGSTMGAAESSDSGNSSGGPNSCAVADLLDLDTELTVDQAGTDHNGLMLLATLDNPMHYGMAGMGIQTGMQDNSWTPNWDNSYQMGHHQQVPPNHPIGHAQPNSYYFSETNPFAAEAVGAFSSPSVAPVHQAPPPLPASDPFVVSSSPALHNHSHYSNTASFGTPSINQDPFGSVTASSIDWGANENAAPAPMANSQATLQQSQMIHANTFANFGQDNNIMKWDSPANGAGRKTVTSLEEAFTKLVDMDALMGSHNKPLSNDTKKNPFEHILNPPKASLNTLVGSGTTTPTPPPPMMHMATGGVVHSTPRPLATATTAPAAAAFDDPFSDDFFR